MTQETEAARVSVEVARVHLAEAREKTFAEGGHVKTFAEGGLVTTSAWPEHVATPLEAVLGQILATLGRIEVALQPVELTPIITPLVAGATDRHCRTDYGDQL